MVFALSNFPAQLPPAKTAVFPPCPPENPKTFILEQCKTVRDLRQVHAHLIKTRLLHRPAAAESLLESAALLLPVPAIDYAQSIFSSLENPHPSAFAVMIRGFTRFNSPEKSILLFRRMIESSVPPSEFTFPGVLKACSKIRAFEEGNQIHAHIAKSKGCFRSREFVENSLIYMYACCNRLDLARQVFEEMPEKTPVAWSSMLSGYSRSSQWEEIVELFKQMSQLGIGLNEATLVTVLSACGRLGDLETGQWIQEYAIANGLMKNISLATSIVDMYAKCGLVENAKELFDSMPRRDVIAWSAMISGFSRANRCKEALALFRDMQNSKVEPNEVTMVSVLSSCAVLGALKTGEWVHSYVKRKKLKVTTNLGTTLVDFYSKCGFVERAIEVFDEMGSSKNVWTWTALIHGLASNGRGEIALKYYKSMLEENIKPNDVTFIGVLTACSHSGLVEEGSRFFMSMKRDFGIEPRIEHYGCIVDLLGRVGLIEEAHAFVKNMPLKPNAMIWRTLLASCRVHKNVEVGEEALKNAARLEPAQSGDYILLSKLYASMGRLEEAKRLRNEMKTLGIEKKIPGFSYIEMDGVIHEFLAEDKAHPQCMQIYESVENMMEKIKRAGYEPDKTQARFDADEDDDKETSVSHHSEKLAIAFGLIGSRPGETIRVAKNLRICTDCHNAIKFVSKVFERDIVVRDRSRFHHFRDGLCSCGDFW
ncbi:Pentatricopeptide repeat-containing protein [Striga hermonthica]|uniref:Pentatricopeptide repeat-containing protein n=1 Tax=Striga hermonthica TaxID=68872 RepID=A0A9N7N2Q2_STRHE|nr:Pentatricopeptide repeat-containing protein [Striga hermonthica]